MPVPTNEVTIGRQFEVAENVDVVVPAGGGDTDLFVITGGPIYLQELTGIVTTAVVGPSGTVIAHLQTVPTAAGGTVDMCRDAPGLDIVSAVDTQFNITGAVGVDMVATIIGIVEAPSFLTNHQILVPGTVRLVIVDTGGMTDITGAVTWTLVYRPLVPGVSVVTA